MIKEKKAIYDHSVDQKQNKWNSKNKLNKVELNRLPDYLRENYKKYSSWIDLQWVLPAVGFSPAFG